MALIFDEQDLLIKGYQINEGTKANKTFIKSMLEREEISEKEYGEIGELLYVKSEIPLDYLKNIDIPDNDRLEKIGLL